MITYEFNFICDGPPVSGSHCMEVWCDGIFEKVSDVRKSWLEARDAGWREAKWKGKTRHLCPNCWKIFIERRNG